MDLAKIRKKSLQQTVEPGVVGTLAVPPAVCELMNSETDAITPTQLPPVSNFFQKDSPVKPDTGLQNELSLLTAARPIREAVYRSPLEAILAGRTAAGCDDESIITEDAAIVVVAESSLEFLCFRVSDEIYGINIMDIKEIIKPRDVTEVPRAPLFVSGVLSLRGTIIPIIDMRLRLGLALETATGKERIIVIKNSESFSGLVVDEVIQVVKIPNNSIEAAPVILDGIDREFVSGIGRANGRLIIILNLEKIADINLG